MKVALLLATLILSGCAGYSASHGPEPLAPEASELGLGISVGKDSGEDAVVVWPELAYNRGLSPGVQAGIRFTGVSVLVEVLASLWENDALTLSAGLGLSLTVTTPALHPELYFGSDRLFVAARGILLLAEPSDGKVSTLARTLWPGVSVGGRLGRAECTHLLPTASAWFDATTMFVFSPNLKLPGGAEC